MQQATNSGIHVETPAMALLVVGACCPVGWHGVGVGLPGLALLAGLSLRKQIAERRTCAMPWLLVSLLAWCALALATMIPGQRPGALREWLQWACILGGGWYAGSALGANARRRLGAAATLGLLASLALALIQSLFPGASAGLVAALHGTPYAAGGTGPELAEELVVGLQRSHLQYCTLVCVALPFALVRLQTLWPRLALLLVCAWTMRPAPFLALVAIEGACLLFARNARGQWRRALALLVVGLAAAMRPGPSPLDWVRPDLPSAEGGQPKRLLIEHRTALATAAKRVLGYGPGTYRESVRRARIEADLPRPNQNRVRRDGNGQYLVLVIETGAAGAACLVAYLLLSLWHGRRDPALATALGASAVAGLSTGLLVRGIGPLAGLLLGLAWTSKRRRSWPHLLAQTGLVAVAIGLGLAWPYREQQPDIPETGLPDTQERIWVEAEAATDIHPSWRVEPAADTGGNRMLRIPLGTGKGVGTAHYRLASPAAGRWKLWLRVRWSGGCANSILVSAAGSQPASVEDAIFGRWHWVDVHPGHTFLLPEGGFELVLQNAEDDVAIDQIALLPDPKDMPVGILQATPAPPPEPESEPKWNFDEEPGPKEESFDKYGE